MDTTPAELAAITVPVLILTGAGELHTKTAKALADAVEDGRHVEVPGDHFSAKTSPEFEEALVGFLAK